jgi:type I restriction enzyme, R subunit
MLCVPQPSITRIAEEAAPYIPLGRNSRGSGWHYVSALSLPRRINDVFIKTYLCEALIRLNPEITASSFS